MSVEAQIRNLIEEKTEISIADFMEMAMSSSSYSYYKSTQPLGVDGDFITSPEVSQMFGEIIGLWVIDIWEKMGSPSKVNLVELGPGRGLLMRDLLNAGKMLEKFTAAIDIYLVDINPILKKEQKSILSAFKVNWIDDLDELPKAPTIFIANEFFDALPIVQYVKLKNLWHENMVSIRYDNNELYFRQKPLMPDLNAQLNSEHTKALDGAILEESRESIRWMQEISDVIAKYKGAALIIDYGYDIKFKKRKTSEYNSTLQGVRNHNYVPILDEVGSVDLSAHVDFNSLSNIASARNLYVYDIITQAEFLKEFGIDIRLNMLKKQNPDLSNILNNQYHRLVSLSQMGNLFKVLRVKS